MFSVLFFDALRAFALYWNCSVLIFPENRNGNFVIPNGLLFEWLHFPWSRPFKMNGTPFCIVNFHNEHSKLFDSENFYSTARMKGANRFAVVVYEMRNISITIILSVVHEVCAFIDLYWSNGLYFWFFDLSKMLFKRKTHLKYKMSYSVVR